jgi:polyhydroxyalkanoate synthesis regulator phasin
MNIRQLIEQTVLMGVGAVSLTKETAQNVVDDLVKLGQAQREEAEDLVNRLTKRGEQERNTLRKLVRDEIHDVVSGLHLATKKDIDALSKKIDELVAK